MALWIALRIVRAVALLLPVTARGEWSREWEAELHHFAARGACKQHLIDPAQLLVRSNH